MSLECDCVFYRMGSRRKTGQVFVTSLAVYNNTACINGREDNNFAPGYQRERYTSAMCTSVRWLRRVG